ncbi:unnamed protein product, partial [Ectocarpus sp. 4 AP-2014]
HSLILYNPKEWKDKRIGSARQGLAVDSYNIWEMCGQESVDLFTSAHHTRTTISLRRPLVLHGMFAHDSILRPSHPNACDPATKTRGRENLSSNAHPFTQGPPPVAANPSP